MNNYEKLKKRHPIRRDIILIILVLLMIVPEKMEAIRVHVPGEDPKKFGISYHIYTTALEPIQPDKIIPTTKIRKHDKKYKPCDKMPYPIEARYWYLDHKPISKDKDMYGTVLTHVLINKKGVVEQCIVVESIKDTSLVEKLVREIKNSTFHPALRKGKTVKVWIGIPVKFVLKTLQIE
ncbi:MAG: hypothetical protein DRP93_03950 [Candidatus Neomarinimicrobiota bacterium]|nr:MAG: hypothetical protein DRP93_03950 [Candidatus Neomarinimicrobiota bacterium]